eukprot:evm.model.scf_484.9 EVM.evm.TU.scf_484.9   scf_484:83477-84461(+)
MGGVCCKACCSQKERDLDPFPTTNDAPPANQATTARGADKPDQPPAAIALDVESRVKNLGKRRTDCRIRDAYKLGRMLGTGGFATVRLATDKHNGEQFAVKIMNLPAEGVDVSENENTR